MQYNIKTRTNCAPEVLYNATSNKNVFLTKLVKVVSIGKHTQDQTIVQKS